MIAVGLNDAAQSTNGGISWQNIAASHGTSATTIAAADGHAAYAGVLQGGQARTYRSPDVGATWQPTS